MGGASANDGVPSVDSDELAISFLGRPEIADLWERVRSGQRIDDPRDRVLVRLAESRAHERAGRLTEAGITANDAIEQSTALDYQIGIAGGLSHLAYVRYRLGNPDDAAKLAREALDDHPPHPHTITALLVLGLIAVDACEWEEALSTVGKSVTLSLTVGELVGSQTLALKSAKSAWTYKR